MTSIQQSLDVFNNNGTGNNNNANNNNPYGSKHCLRRYLTLQIIVNYTPNTS